VVVTEEETSVEKALLGVILIVAVVAIVRIVRRSLAAAADSSSPGCAGCPFESKCEMQDKPHMDGCGDPGDDS
jgi:hypothetical protein